MELIQHGFSCSYEMGIFINIFFKSDEEGVITTNFSHKNDLISVVCEIEFEGKRYEERGEYPFLQKETDKRLIKKVCGCACVRTFTECARKIRNITLPWGAMSGIRPAKSVRQLLESGKSETEAMEVLEKVYGVSAEKRALALRVARNEEEILKKIKKNSVSLYIGIPFCPSRCLYCSFVSTDVRVSGKYMDEFSELLCREIEKTGEILSELGFFVQNIYIGGGTPTTLSNENLEKILSAIEKNIDFSNLEEYTLEAGRPDTVTYEKMDTAKRHGVNRISINPQTMHDKTLEVIGRRHSVSMYYDAMKIARDAGFENINTDLIAGLPGETFSDFAESLDKVREAGPEEITVHSMCVKRAAALKFSGIGLTGYEEVNKMLEYTAEKMDEDGKEPYYMYRQKNISGNLENVGYAKREHMSSYNINIMEEAQSIFALGGGGSSKIVLGDRIERVVNFKEPYEYIRRFDEIIAKKDEIADYFRKG